MVEDGGVVGVGVARGFRFGGEVREVGDVAAVSRLFELEVVGGGGLRIGLVEVRGFEAALFLRGD